ncbi:hypothetical protein PG988_007931 [Apiospora saccharicola]
MVPQLPPEIWRLVFTQLSSEVSRAKRRILERQVIGIPTITNDWNARRRVTKALMNLCQVSRGFGALAQPELFRLYEPVDGKLSNTLPQYISFLQTILARPDLADCVREVHLGRLGHFIRSSHGRRTYRQMALCLRFDAADLRPVGNRSSAEGLHMLAMLLTRNIEVMSARMQQLPDAMGFLEQITAMGVAKPLERVRDLTLQSRGDEFSNFELCSIEPCNNFELCRFFPLLALTPNVTRLCLVHCDITWIPYGQPHQRRRLEKYVPRGLKTLEIWHSCIQHESMGILLAHLTNLETFVYYTRKCWNAGTTATYANARGREVTAKQLVHHLLPAKDTLKNLRLCWHKPHQYLNGEDLGDDPARVTEDDFAEFACLRDDTGFRGYDWGTVVFEEWWMPDTVDRPIEYILARSRGGDEDEPPDTQR